MDNMNLNSAWVQIHVDKIYTPCESQPVFDMECPICGRSENIMGEAMEMDGYFKRVSVKHDVSFLLCASCYDYLVEKLKEAHGIYNSDE